ncbi:MAG: hypothetical protein K6G64_11005 [Eubacterium sp.]|nr:hypothetical protein [Eubacterium sp.]
MNNMENFGSRPADAINSIFTRKQKIQAFLGALAFIIVGLGVLCYGIHTNNQLNKTQTTLESLLKKDNVSGEYVKGPIAYSSSEFYEVDHKIMHLITTDKDCYYVVYEKEGKKGIVVKADEDWAKNFDSTTHEALNEVIVRGKVKSTDWDIKHYIEQEGIAEAGGDNFIYAYYIDTEAESGARRCMIGGGSVLLVMLSIAILSFATNKILGKTMAGVAMVGLVVTLLCIFSVV